MKLFQVKTGVLNFIVISLIILGFPVSGQSQTSYKQTADSYISIAGTSTMHNWTMTSKETQYQATFESSADGTLGQLKSLSMSVPSQSLKSGHSAMDKNAYRALKTDKNKMITLKLTTASILKNIIQCTGNLTIAGVTKLIDIEATCVVNPDKSMHCTGSKPIKMSDYGVEAPKFMFGTVKTGDDITISFNVMLAPVKK